MRLLFVGLFDELAGVGPVAAGDIQADLALSYTAAALALFTIPDAIAQVIEPPLLLAADRWGTRIGMMAGLALMGIGLIACAFAWDMPSLAAATTVYFIGSGVGVNLAKATLIDLAEEEDQTRRLARWTLAGAVGDIGAPAIVAACAALAVGWRGAFVFIGIGILMQLFWLGSVPELPAEPKPPARALLTNRRMLLWLFASATCGLLDEVFIAFGGLWLLESLHLETSGRSLVLGFFMAGGIVGLLILERWLDVWSNRQILRVASLACAGALLGWIYAPGVISSTVLLALVGVFAAQLWPLTESEAYAAWPGSAAQVEVASYLFAPVSMGLPLLLGLVADTWGLAPALLLLFLQPLVVFVVAMVDGVGETAPPAPGRGG